MAAPDPGRRAAPSASVVDVALFVAALGLSAFVLLWPTAPGPPLFPYADLVVHAVVFAALAWTGSRLGPPTAVLAGGLVAYAVGSELAQLTLLPARSGSWADVAADLLGSAAGLWVGRRAGE